MSPWRSRRRLLGLGLVVLMLSGLGIGLYSYLHSGGRRVLIVGDSLTFQSTSAIESDLGQHGFDARVVATFGSGLLDTKVNWPDRLRQLVASFDPDEVVVEFVGNYGLFGTRPDVVDKSPSFYQQWTSEAQDVENILSSRHAVVYWVIGPPVRDPAGNEKVVALSDIYKNLHAPGILSSNPPTIDEFAAFGKSDGSYTDVGPAANGKVMQLRSSDGIHFTQAGALVFAQTLSNAVVGGTKRHARVGEVSLSWPAATAVR